LERFHFILPFSTFCHHHLLIVQFFFLIAKNLCSRQKPNIIDWNLKQL
jgi:hypothetical protein